MDKPGQSSGVLGMESRQRMPQAIRMNSIVLTGCTRGLGRAMVDFFATSGLIVHGCGTNRAAIEKLRVEHPTPHTFSVVDLTDDNAVARWADGVLKNGATRFLINNAACIARNASLWDLEASEIDAVVDVNIKGTINTIRHFLPAMIDSGDGIIVNFSSGWGRSTSPDVAVYCASKFAIEGLTAALAQELPASLAAIALNPGVINTDMLTSCFGSGASSYPGPDEWIKLAGPFILGLKESDNGKSLSVPSLAD